MNTLAAQYPSLTKFSDLDWEAVAREYEKVKDDISFPEYLQIKAEEGDCPPYLFELAFFEMALREIENPAIAMPHTSGIHLNPTALFLNFDFDILKMLAGLDQNKIEYHERPHTLCLFRDLQGEVQSLEIEDDVLALLLDLEDGPQPDEEFAAEFPEVFTNLVILGLILKK